MPRGETRGVDFAVVGSGVAGLRAAIGLAEAWKSVLLLTKDSPEDSSTDRAQGGVAVVLSEEDEISLHFEDTLRAGAGLSEEAAARILVEDGPGAILELMEWGAEFDRQGLRLAFGREAAHSARRVLHAGGDATGREIVRVLLAKASSYPNITVIPRSSATDLLVQRGECAGVRYLDEDLGAHVMALTRGVLLATGGAARVYRENTNPPQATGDGIAMAWLAGAELMDMEFVQFHPTTLCLPDEPRWLLTEALRGEGGVLRDGRGRRFMPAVHPDAELAPRDVVSRGIVEELRRSGDPNVFLDLSHLEAGFLRKRFPGISALCSRHGIDFTREAIPVLPAAHYFMGGVRTDLAGRTSVSGLYAAGEAACSGVHGANRLASNSLLEGLVFGARAAAAMLADDRALPVPPVAATEGERGFEESVADASAEEVRAASWDGLGVIRDGAGIERAAGRLAAAQRGARSAEISRRGVEARNLCEVALAVARAAAWRRESRGAHYRSDHPRTDDAGYRCHSLQRRGRDVDAAPVGSGPISG